MKSFLFAANGRKPTSDDLTRIFQSETAEIRTVAGPIRSRRAVLLLAGLFVSMMVIAASFQLDRVVSSVFGQIVTVEPTTVKQAFDLSIIKTIDVREGERVKKGQLLATLDPTIAASDVDALRLQIASLDAEIARCEAELRQRPFVYTPGTGPGQARYAAVQQAYYVQRKAQYDAQLKAYDAQIAQYKAMIYELTNDAARYGDRTNLAQNIQDMKAALFKSQVDSRLSLLEAADKKVEMQRSLQADQNNIAVNQQQIHSTQAARDAYIQQWRAQTSQDLVTALNQRDVAQQQLQAALKHLDVVRLYAPDAAMVLRLAKLSVGSVLAPGENFIELAMMRSPVEAEIYIDPRDVGFVRPGDHVTIKLDSYNFIEHGVAEGKLRWVSPGTFTTPATGTGGMVNLAGTSPGTATVAGSSGAQDASQLTTPFYKARISITKLDLKGVPKDFRLLPGMTLTADIHVGTRSVFWYLFSGIARGYDQAMREP